jgi:hypothetical protein
MTTNAQTSFIASGIGGTGISGLGGTGIAA